MRDSQKCVFPTIATPHLAGTIFLRHTVWWTKNPANQLRLVGFFPIIYKVLYTSQGRLFRISEPSTGRSPPWFRWFVGSGPRTWTSEINKNSRPSTFLGGEIVLYLGWWRLKYFYFHPYFSGRWTHFDSHFFKGGWFNHQLVIFLGIHTFLKQIHGR